MIALDARYNVSISRAIITHVQASLRKEISGNMIEQFSKIEDGQRCQLGSHHWYIARLVTLVKDFDVMEIPIEHLNVYYTYKNLTLRNMATHINAVNDADLNYPIILDEDGELMDGRHRIMKALVTGAKTIKAVRFDKNPPPCEVIDE